MVMKIEYEAGTLRVENARGLRWQLDDVKPEFSFSYDALSVTEQHAVRPAASARLMSPPDY